MTQREEMAMTFKVWMRRHYRNGISEKGDLARHICTDDSFPMNGYGKFDGWHSVITDYLHGRGAAPFVMMTFEQCWEEYVKCEKERLNRSSRRR